MCGELKSPEERKGKLGFLFRKGKEGKKEEEEEAFGKWVWNLPLISTEG